MHTSQLQGFRPGTSCNCPRGVAVPQRSLRKSCSRPQTSLAAQAPTTLPQSSELDEPIVNSEAAGPTGPDNRPDGRPIPRYNRQGGPGGQQRFQRGQQREGGYQRSPRQDGGGGGFQGFQDRDERPPPVPIENHGLQVGDTVVATVSWVGDRGCRAELESDPSIKGFLPYSHSPYQLRNQESRPGSLTVPLGLKREFLITALPEVVERNGRGPLLNAKELDRTICWRRAQQLCELSAQEKEWVQLEIESANRGGLVAFFEGTVVFIPFSRIPKEAGSIITPEELEATWVGKTVDVVIEQVEPDNNKIIGSIRTAIRYRYARDMAVGKVLWATVQRLASFGAFLRPEGGEVDGLLHISAISKQRVDDVQDVFEIGERVRVLVAGMEDDMRRISFSTALLEVNSGDMLLDKNSVYETAEEMAQAFIEGGMQQAAAPRRERRDNRYNNNDSGYNRGKNDFDFDDFSSGNGSGGGFNDVWDN